MMSRALTTDGAKKNFSILREPASEGSGCERGRAMRIYRDHSETGVHPLINGAHVVVYTKDAEADRAFFRDVLQFSSVDAGHGWLIFAMPPLEAAFHDSDKNDQHELFLMCDDMAATLRGLKSKGVKVSDVSEQRWGKLATLTLPSRGKIDLYEPNHPTPLKLER